ncbi:MAG: alpha/beta fold hydrolase [Arenimonas sp.]|nr:alpha/beta fold hydrolase [Arenimonas sp.]
MQCLESSYTAHGLLRNAHVQSVLSSSAWRKQSGLNRLAALGVMAQPRILALPDGTRLSGLYYAAPVAVRRNALTLLLHGWEGSAQSSYINHSAAELLAEGIDVFALNFRDHGQSHELNEGLFHSNRLQEVVDAARQVHQTFRPAHFFVAGYSLGGNFTLRLALSAPAQGLPIDAAFSICPPVDPSAVLRILETGPAFYHWYFMKKWRGSLRRKRELFPHVHVFGDDILQRDMRGLTQWLVEQHTEWDNEEDYFAGYAVAGQTLAGLRVPTRILAAQDDPVIPVASLQGLQASDAVRLEISAHGGHCGFIENWRLRGFAERWLKNGVVQALNAIQ